MQNEEGTHITSDEVRQHLVTRNRLVELPKPKVTDQIAVTAVTRSARRRRLQPETLQEEVVQQMRSERIVQAQNEKKWIADLKAYLQGNLADLTAVEAKACYKIADDYDVDDDELLLYCPTTAQSCGNRDLIARLVVPIMYVADINQRDWDEYAERLTFALNTARDRVRSDTPFYLAHGWDPQTTLEAPLPLVSTRRRDRDPRRWRYHVQAHYQRAREQVRERLREAIRERAD
ncbi:unnamed protein product [Phytophthora fragariaefolia]|uniref:Unnamed protein product n=1 Tax=Phytophthora fragariaefolia TaxID=1490495 RepID=A0A9W6XRB9_9STRA|nr:unnamed protein product [Phytophthora fragariaefolia]